MSDAAATPARIDPFALLRDHPVESAFLLVAALLIIFSVVLAWFPKRSRLDRDEIIKHVWGWRGPFTALFLLAFLAAFLALLATILNPGAAGLGTGALIVALLGAPFLIWRSIVAQKTVDLQAEALLNDKLNAAATDLAARRQVTRVVGRAGKQEVLTEWEDDLFTRAAAIDRLEALANENPGLAVRIASLLSIYVRELSKQYPAEDPTPNATRHEMQLWASSRKPVRSDVEKALQAIVRLDTKYGLESASGLSDFRGANLQGFNLSGLVLHGAQLSNARLEGADLTDTKLENADLRMAQMQGAILLRARMNGARMARANLSYSDLRDAQLKVADLRGSILEEAVMEGAIVTGARLSAAQMQQIDLAMADLSMTDLSGAKMNEADLDGTRLKGARLIGANLNGVQMNENTSFSDATLFGAMLRDASVPDGVLSTEQIATMFGDGSVTLLGIDPGGPRWPPHWPTWELDITRFHDEWRKWQADRAGYRPPPPPDEADASAP